MFNQYVLILVWLGFMALLQGRFYREEYNELIDDYDWRVTPVFAFMVMLPVIWMAGWRQGFGDTWTYAVAYTNLPSSWSGLPQYFATITKDSLYYRAEAVFKVLTGTEARGWFVFIAAFQSFCLMKMFRKYSDDVVLPIFLFVASSDFLSWMCNGIRQFTAVSIILLGTRFYIEKKWVKSILIIVFASFFHQSALLMIPFIFIAHGKIWNKRTLMFLFGVLISLTAVDRFTNILDGMLSVTQYGNVVSDYTTLFQDDGTNPLRVLVYALPAILSFFLREGIEENDSPVLRFCTNMSIVSAGMYLISMVTSGIFLGRLPIYCSLYSYILLTWEIKNIFGPNNKNMAMVMAVSGYLLFYYYQLHFAWGLV